MTIQQLRYLIAISQAKSINKASNDLFVTQSNISKAVKQLEDELGFTILERQSKGVSFTIKGMEFLRESFTLVERFDSLKENFSTAGNTASLSVASQHYIFVLMAMNALIKRFKSEQQYSVKLHEVVTLKIIEEVSLRICDIGFIYYYDTTEEFIKRELKRTNLIYHPLCDARPCVYLSKNHPLADEKSLSLSQLAGYPYICYDLGTDSNSFAEEIYAPHNTHKVISVTDRSSMLKLIAHTNAYTTGSGTMVREFLDDNIITVPMVSNGIHIHIGWIESAAAHENPYIHDFISLCLDALRRCNEENPDIGVAFTAL